jgi:hypothetical protein
LRIDIVVPTFRRKDKIIKCIASIYEALKLVINDYYIYTFIYTSDNDDYQYLSQYFNIARWILIKRYEYPYESSSKFWNDHLAQYKADIFFYLNDDVLLAPDCLYQAINSMKLHFPNYDGLIGLNQENIPYNDACKAAFGALGGELIDRFPNRNPFCPDYRRFYLDQELGIYTTKLEKFYWEKDAKLLHLHPAYNEKWHDTTHDIVRTHLASDRRTFNARQYRKCVWGETFDLVNNYPYTITPTQC